MDNALTLIYYTWKKAIAFLLGSSIDDAGNVSILFIYLAVFLFGILIRFVLAVPRTYRGRPDHVQSRKEG